MTGVQTCALPISLGARAAAFTRDHLDQLIGRLPEDRRADLVYGLTQACDAATRDGIEKLARTRLASYRGGKRTVEEAIERMDDCIAQKALIGPELAHYLGAK